MQGRKKYQFLRLQLTAGLDAAGNEVLSYSKDVVKLPKNMADDVNDPQ